MSSAGSHRQRLARASDVLGLALPASVQDQLIAYLSLLQRWNKVYNLTALREADDMLTHHLFDCLAALAALRPWAAGRALNVLDVGSGGGLPGAVLAIAQPDWSVSCIDTVAKKASFIRQVAAELTLPKLYALHARVELHQAAGHDLIVSRAFASLADFSRLTRHLLAPTGVWAAMKAHLSDAEAAELPPDVAMFHVEQLRVPELDAQRCLVWMRHQSGSVSA